MFFKIPNSKVQISNKLQFRNLNNLMHFLVLKIVIYLLFGACNLLFELEIFLCICMTKRFQAFYPHFAWQGSPYYLYFRQYPEDWVKVDELLLFYTLVKLWICLSFIFIQRNKKHQAWKRWASFFGVLFYNNLFVTSSTKRVSYLEEIISHLCVRC